ncbi:hypothetical protein Z043_126034 [Scleropages formosus]|uniref:Sphingosine-1-phosphate phosphatase 1 n=1 Tax=Scleropages formosus TaxID=113540 RepID=A0A0P7UCH4_SCLFO|nr:hypothetical protein Z043_126034 [Scleropages formosus]
MAKHLKTEFLGLCRYLQDPHLVARFQRTCGVQGTFPRRCEEHNGDCAKDDLRQRSRPVQVERSPALMNGAAQPTAHSECSLQETDSRGTLKPLRKNSLTGDIGQEFIIENRPLFYLFTFGTELGNEMFFIIFFPFLYWNVDACVSRRLIIVWELILYLGQCAKDLVRWTRPASPPVVKVEVFYNTEYSMPSTHAMTGTALPLSLLLLTYGRWQVCLHHPTVTQFCWFRQLAAQGCLP